MPTSPTSPPSLFLFCFFLFCLLLGEACIYEAVLLARVVSTAWVAWPKRCRKRASLCLRYVLQQTYKLLKLQLMLTSATEILSMCSSLPPTGAAAAAAGAVLCTSTSSSAALPLVLHQNVQASEGTQRASAAYLSCYNVIQMKLYASGRCSIGHCTARLCLFSCCFPLLALACWRSRRLLRCVVSCDGHTPVASQTGTLRRGTGLVMH